MGFLKKKSPQERPAAKSGTASTTPSRASPAAFVASKASNVESRDDASTTAAGARAAARSRSDSDSAANQVKTASTPPLNRSRGDQPLSSSSVVVASSPSRRVQSVHGSDASKSLSTLKNALPKRPNASAAPGVVKSKGGQHAAKGGRSNPKTRSRSSRSKPKSPKEKKTITSSKKSTRKGMPIPRNNWKHKDSTSVSSNGSSDDSDIEDDDSEGSDDSSMDNDDDGNTDTEDDGHTEVEEESFVSIGYNSTNTGTDDPDVSLDSSSSGDTYDDDTREEVSDSRENILSPKLMGMFGKLGGWKAKCSEATEDDESDPKSLASYAKNSGHDDFLKKMDAFVAKNPEHQLLVQVSEHGNIKKLSIHEIALIPTPYRPTDIVIKVECSTVNLQDCMIRRGKWYEMQNLPFIPGSDFVGTIHEIGSEAAKISTFQVGDRVAALVPSGGNAKYITVEYRSIIRVPPEVDSESALCLSSTYVPAREALDLGRKMNTPFTGANILVIGGNGPSGLATIELALLEGANVYATADERHHEYLAKLGAKCFPIDPAKWLPTLTGKMDVVLDSVCLDGYKSSSLALNSAGILVCTGMSAVYTQGAMPTLMLKDDRDVRAMYFKTRVKFLWDNAVYYDRVERFASAPNEYAQHFRYLCHLASKGTITPLVSTRAPLNKVASLQRAIELGNTTYGICVCAPWTTQVDSVAEETASTPKK